MKKIAAIVPYTFLPGQSGGQKLIIGFYDALGKRTDLHVIGTPENDEKQSGHYKLQKLLRSSQFRYADIFSFFRIKSYLKQNKIEWLFIEHPYLGWLAWLLKTALGIKLAVHTHNIEHQRFRSIQKWWWKLLKWYERWVLKKADLVLCITEEDRNGFTKEMGIAESKCIVVPYGISQLNIPADKRSIKESVCRELNISSNTHLLFFNGVLNYLPNLDALNVILDQINPLLLETGMNYRILIAGKNLPAEHDELKKWNNLNIIYLGFVDDIDRYTKAADVLLNPVQSGGGIKTKMIEALGFNTSVISVQSGAAGVSPEYCGKKLTVIPDNNWNDFTKAIMTVLQNPGSDTPASFYQLFSWESIVEKVLIRL